MVLLSKINPYSIANDPLILEHQKLKPEAYILEQRLEESKNAFRLFTIKLLFDYENSLKQFQRFNRVLHEMASSFNKETIDHQKEVLDALQEVWSAVR